MDRIEGVVAIDEWSASKQDILAKLDEGWLCFAAKHGEQVVGCAWAYTGSAFEDTYMRRVFHLAGNEAYFWRFSCSRPFRGKGIIPALVNHMARDLAQERGKTKGLAITRTENKPMLRAYLKMGWPSLGRVGFLELAGLRLHYLFGNAAFPETKKRVFLSRV